MTGKMIVRMKLNDTLEAALSNGDKGTVEFLPDDKGVRLMVGGQAFEFQLAQMAPEEHVQCVKVNEEAVVKEPQPLESLGGIDYKCVVRPESAIDQALQRTRKRASQIEVSKQQRGTLTMDDSEAEEDAALKPATKSFKPAGAPQPQHQQLARNTPTSGLRLQQQIQQQHREDTQSPSKKPTLPSNLASTPSSTPLSSSAPRWLRTPTPSDSSPAQPRLTPNHGGAAGSSGSSVVLRAAEQWKKIQEQEQLKQQQRASGFKKATARDSGKEETNTKVERHMQISERGSDEDQEEKREEEGEQASEDECSTASQQESPSRPATAVHVPTAQTTEVSTASTSTASTLSAHRAQPMPSCSSGMTCSMAQEVFRLSFPLYRSMQGVLDAVQEEFKSLSNLMEKLQKEGKDGDAACMKELLQERFDELEEMYAHIHRVAQGRYTALDALRKL